MDLVAIKEMPRWPRPDPRLIALPGGSVFVLLTAWERSTFGARVQRWRVMWQERSIDVGGFRRALQGVE